MLGFLIGTVCLIALFKLLKRHRGGYGCGSDWGGGHWRGGGWGRHGDWHEGERHRSSGRGRWGWGPGAFLGAIAEQLEATPAQEKVIREAAEEIRAAADQLRGEGRASRKDVARAVRSPSFDETVLGELFARHDTALEGMRKSVVGALGRVHAVLDDRQRERLARMLEDGPFGGPYRERAWL